MTVDTSALNGLADNDAGQLGDQESADGGGAAVRRWSPFATAALFLLPTAAALVSILKDLSGRQLWRDEHATWWAAGLSFGDLGHLIRSIDAVFTPYYILMHFWVDAAGDSASALRLPSAIAMGAAAGLLALLARRMFTTQVGVVAGLAFAVVPTVTRYGQEARPYAFAVAAVLLSTLLLVRALEQPTFKGWIGYTLSVPLIGWSHLASMAVLLPHVVMVVIARRRGNHIAAWAYAAAGTMGLCFVLPMAAAGSTQKGQISWNNPGTKDLVNLPQHLFGSWAVGAPVMALGLVGLCFAGRYALPLALWVLVPPLATYATAAQLHLFLPRYLLFTVPAWVLLAAVAVCRLAGPVTGRLAGQVPTFRIAVGWVLAAASVAALAWSALPGIREARGPILGEPDFRGVARIIKDGQQPHDGIAFGGVMTERRGMAYELRDDSGRPHDVLMARTPQQAGMYDAVECKHPVACLAKTDRLWLVTTSPPGLQYVNMPKATADVLRKEFRVIRTTKLTDIQVLLLKRVVTAATGSSGDSAADRKVHT
ncbi:glycosyltransferase family 39 protein [Actinacidiphila rubida]|uniref:Mannosyltransferase n=1 Tax=Actinacidiphila rubida TaxID=310780 RepID=A0A1H8QWT2_9ACTN|nr:glycosyltransferase family 39 protein [Actinacidiphila rubida]SEO58368.1 mannosyltransferase [Actinacidiphila rubida]